MSNKLATLLLTVAGLALSPFIILGLITLVTVAVVVSTLTSSFILIRLVMLILEVLSSLTITSTNWLLSTTVHTLGKHLWGWSHQQNQSILHQRIMEQRKSSSSIARRRKRSMTKLDVPERYLPKRRSVSNPGTPIRHHGNYFDTKAATLGLEMTTRPQIVASL
ncbi:hypothetical protein BC943DRAFT_360366 [Umbelopsis sp. AD052]|nr:hypothetical protein BC943DRAFT_360366 [Umbelopsis sp. AD052]